MSLQKSESGTPGIWNERPDNEATIRSKLGSDSWPELAEVMANLDLVIACDSPALWEIEDELRRCESQEYFGPRFVTLARSVYQCNDRRSALKRRINDLLGAEIRAEKAYRNGVAEAIEKRKEIV